MDKCSYSCVGSWASLPMGCMWYTGVVPFFSFFRCLVFVCSVVSDVSWLRPRRLYLSGRRSWMYSLSQKSSPVKLFMIFSLMVNLCNSREAKSIFGGLKNPRWHSLLKVGTQLILIKKGVSYKIREGATSNFAHLRISGVLWGLVGQIS